MMACADTSLPRRIWSGVGGYSKEQRVASSDGRRRRNARYFRDQALLDAMAIVYSSVSDATNALLDYGIFDQWPGAFADLQMLPMVNSDATLFGGTRRLE
jgi:hypothetical protein